MNSCKEFNNNNYISLYKQPKLPHAYNDFPRWQLCMMPHPSQTVYDDEKRGFVPVIVPTIITKKY